MLILLIWAGLCNTALILKDRLVVIAAARETGRYYAAISQNESQAQKKGYEILANGNIAKNRATIKIYRNNPSSNLVRCEVTCDVPVAIPGAGALFGGDAWKNQITVKESVVFRLET
ncbi:MAG: hypothetical protein VR67_17465 [Peptococcaceae bacterium BRH_c8a]|nr:MAG: hypothetical protein VR67_17465 [Peptococcaceae bacterium BRH_c8a]